MSTSLNDIVRENKFIQHIKTLLLIILYNLYNVQSFWITKAIIPLSMQQMHQERSILNKSII